jgi:Flp pilus assembly protein TadG
MSTYFAFLVVALFAMVGLVVDGGRALAMERLAEDQAQQAARAGAAALSVSALRAGDLSLDEGAAVQAAERALAEEGATGVASATSRSVTVTVRADAPSVMLGIVGIDRLHVTAHATATFVHGVSSSD